MPRQLSGSTPEAAHEAGKESAEPMAPVAAIRRLRPAPAQPTGRVRHDEKITVYVSADELVALEHARLVLRAEHGIAVDRGRLVREAVAELLLGLEEQGEASAVVARLRGS